MAGESWPSLVAGSLSSSATLAAASMLVIVAVCSCALGVWHARRAVARRTSLMTSATAQAEAQLARSIADDGGWRRDSTLPEPAAEVACTHAIEAHMFVTAGTPKKKRRPSRTLRAEWCTSPSGSHPGSRRGSLDSTSSSEFSRVDVGGALGSARAVGHGPRLSPLRKSQTYGRPTDKSGSKTVTLHLADVPGLVGDGDSSSKRGPWLAALAAVRLGFGPRGEHEAAAGAHGADEEAAPAARARNGGTDADAAPEYDARSLGSSSGYEPRAWDLIRAAAAEARCGGAGLDGQRRGRSGRHGSCSSRSSEPASGEGGWLGDSSERAADEAERELQLRIAVGRSGFALPPRAVERAITSTARDLAVSSPLASPKAEAAPPPQPPAQLPTHHAAAQGRAPCAGGTTSVALSPIPSHPPSTCDSPGLLLPAARRGDMD